MVKCGSIFILPYECIFTPDHFRFMQNKSDFLLGFLSGKNQTSKKCHACAEVIKRINMLFMPTCMQINSSELQNSQT